jgi:hypothetical protein
VLEVKLGSELAQALCHERIRSKVHHVATGALNLIDRAVQCNRFPGSRFTDDEQRPSGCLPHECRCTRPVDPDPCKANVDGHEVLESPGGRSGMLLQSLDIVSEAPDRTEVVSLVDQDFLQPGPVETAPPFRAKGECLDQR